MSRVESPAAPSELIYQQMYCDWQSLSELFSQYDPRGCPTLALYRSYRNLTHSLDSLEFQPQKSYEAAVKQVITQNNGMFSSYYVKKLHAVILNREEDDSLNDPLTHEVTHGVLNLPNSNITITSVQAHHFDGFNPEFGSKISEAMKRYRIYKMKINVDEFFPPLAQAYIFGRDFLLPHRIPEMLDYFLEKGCSNWFYFDFWIMLKHLPQLAGEMIVDLYEGDIKSLIKENPQITRLPGPELWDLYCKPLLTSGKL